MKLRTARLVSCRAVSPPRSRSVAQQSRVRRDWLATLLGVILLFGDKNLFAQVTDEFDRSCERRQVELRRAGNRTRPLAVVFGTSQGRFVLKGRKPGGIGGLQGLKYVKGKDKVLLLRPSTGIVVDEVTM